MEQEGAIYIPFRKIQSPFPTEQAFPINQLTAHGQHSYTLLYRNGLIQVKQNVMKQQHQPPKDMMLSPSEQQILLPA